MEGERPGMQIVTIGAYGYAPEAFFDALQGAGVQVFVDLRQRRGLRGQEYGFANATRLQTRLAESGIRYLHMRDLAPSKDLRAVQWRADEAQAEVKRSRSRLSEGFAAAYRDQHLAAFDGAAFLDAVGGVNAVVALFCVESSPDACHRSLVADHLHTKFGLPVRHLMP